MNLRRLYQPLLITVGGGLVFALFQNMTFPEFVALNISQVDEPSRLDQSRELLGDYYYNSVAHKLEGHQHLNYFIFNEIEHGLPARWKADVPALTEAVIEESKAEGLDPVFVLAIIRTESQFNPLAVGTSGEIGLMQVRPETAAWLAQKYKIPWHGASSLYDPVTNVKMGTLYLAHLRATFETEAPLYIHAYNMGSANVRRLNRALASTDDDYASDDLIKKGYAKRVMRNYALIYRKLERADSSLGL